jgi:putative membrane protein
MKNACLTLAVVVVSVLLIGLPASAQTAQQQRSGQTSDPFIIRAMQMNQAEIDLGKMAQSKTQNPRVKEYADMMVLDHSQAQEKLRGTSGASQGQVQLSKEQQQLSDKLSRLDGQQFDKEYMAAMVKDHRQAVQIFQKEAGTGTSGTTQRQKPAGANSNDASIAQEMLPTLQKHLSEAEQISRSIGSTANPTR